MRMTLDAKAVHKPFRKLEKLLKDVPEAPAPGYVHDVRTQTRRVEAIARAFEFSDRKSLRGLVKALKPIRTNAGDVRDMDVLIDLAASLEPDEDANCRLQLIEELARRRKKAAAKLAKEVNASAKQLRSSLKQSRKFAELGLDAADSRNANSKHKQASREKSAHSMASSFTIEQELSAWRRLTAANIHPFRLKVKEWRYVLQLGQYSDSKLINALGKVKDQIGLWHDWSELARIASKVLDHDRQCAIVAQIRSRTKLEFAQALDSANAFRARYLRTRGDRRKSKTDMNPAVAKATSRLGR